VRRFVFDQQFVYPAVAAASDKQVTVNFPTLGQVSMLQKSPLKFLGYGQDLSAERLAGKPFS
jgi:hypothetical protein